MERTPLVLLHGFTNTGASWRPVMAALPERYRPIAPDLRGHGAASDVRPVSLDAVIADIASLAPPEEPFALAGYSMGGRLALHAALALHDRVTRLVVIGGSPGIADPRDRRERQRADEQLAAEVERSDIEAFARRWARTPILAGIAPELARAAHEDRLRSTPAGLADALRALGTGALPSLWERLGELRMPVSLIAGERDTKFRAIAQAMAPRIGQCEIVIVPGAGHAAHLEAPQGVAAVLARAPLDVRYARSDPALPAQ